MKDMALLTILAVVTLGIAIPLFKRTLWTHLAAGMPRAPEGPI
jgi:hypothetical protein